MDGPDIEHLLEGELLRVRMGPKLVTGAESDWRSLLIRGKATKDGPAEPKALLANAIIALREAPDWKGALSFNEFSLSVGLLSPAPWGGAAGVAWSDQEDRLTADWLQHQGIYVTADVACQAVQTVAMDRRFHPVRDYLDSLRWDGTKRIDTWLSLYIGSESNDYTAAVGARWLISAVARIYRPGAKADCCLILEGKQGIRKSTALQTLAGEWFTDEIAELGTKDASLQTLGVWVIEIAELDGMSRAELSKVKAFMSRTVDRFRPPYGKRLIESPRQCTFAGSVNHDTYLRDETGGRRFWPVCCGRIRVHELARDRDQLWAEAVARYRDGASWWLDSIELNRVAEHEQVARYESDAWDPLIIEWATNRTDSGHDSISVGEVLELCLGKMKDRWDRADQMRVSRCLRANGWERYRDRKRDMEWRYRLPKPPNVPI